jgi:hypothetical protein
MTDHHRDVHSHVPFLDPIRGQVITYVPPDAAGVPLFARAVATGAVIVDPGTGNRWLPVIRPDLLPELVSEARVVVFEPPTRPHRPRPR